LDLYVYISESFSIKLTNSIIPIFEDVDNGVIKE